MRAKPDLAHGLAGRLVHADWPALRLAEITRVVAHYPDAGAPVHITWRSRRPFSAAVLIESVHGCFFLKRHHQSVRSKATLVEEHRFMAHLRARGAPVPAVLANADGDTATALGEWLYELHACAGGVDVYRDSPSWEPLANLAHARSAGHALAALHAFATGYRAPQRQTHILVARSELLCADDPVAALQTELAERTGLGEYLRGRDWQRELSLAFTESDISARLAAQPPLWTHGDWHVSNLCWSGDDAGAEVTAVLDFGLSAANFALFDLATAIERNAIAWLALDARAGRVPIALALLAGYRECRPLSGADVMLLADLLPRVHLDFALSEVEYYHAITHSDDNADVAYDTFLLGHAAWFRTAAGRRFLDALRAAA